MHHPMLLSNTPGTPGASPDTPPLWFHRCQKKDKGDPLARVLRLRCLGKLRWELEMWDLVLADGGVLRGKEAGACQGVVGGGVLRGREGGIGSSCGFAPSGPICSSSLPRSAYCANLP